MNQEFPNQVHKLRILHVTLGFYPAVGWGGPVKTVHQSCKELVKRGHQVTVYCTNLLDKKKKIQPGTFERQIDGIRVVYFDTWNLRNWPGTLGPIWLPDLPVYLKREIAGFDVVHLNGYRGPTNVIIAQAARCAGVPIIIQPHGSLPVLVNTFILKHVYDILFGRFELNGISALIALQESEKQQAIVRGVPEGRIDIIPNGIDITQIEKMPPRGSFRRQYNLDTTKPIILFLGRINKIKGTDMLIEAFVKLKNIDAQLVIAGKDDGQLEEVQEMIDRYGIENRVTYTGLLSGQDVFSAFNDSDLFVLPSRYDSFPVTIMEACLTGTPMVVTDRCDIAELIRNRVATIVPFDAGAFSHAMQDLLLDQKKYYKYQQNALKMAKDTFSIGAVVDQLITVYERAILEK